MYRLAKKAAKGYLVPILPPFTTEVSISIGGIMVVVLIDALLQSDIPSAGLTDVTGPEQVEGPQKVPSAPFPQK